MGQGSHPSCFPVPATVSTALRRGTETGSQGPRRPPPQSMPAWQWVRGPVTPHRGPCQRGPWTGRVAVSQRPRHPPPRSMSAWPLDGQSGSESGAPSPPTAVHVSVAPGRAERQAAGQGQLWVRGQCPAVRPAQASRKLRLTHGSH